MNGGVCVLARVQVNANHPGKCHGSNRVSHVNVKGHSTKNKNCCIAGHFCQRKISSKATVRNLFSSNATIVARLLFDRSVVALLLIIYLHIHEYF